MTPPGRPRCALIQPAAPKARRRHALRFGDVRRVRSPQDRRHRHQLTHLRRLQAGNPDRHLPARRLKVRRRPALRLGDVRRVRSPRDRGNRHHLSHLRRLQAGIPDRHLPARRLKVRRRHALRLRVFAESAAPETAATVTTSAISAASEPAGLPARFLPARRLKVRRCHALRLGDVRRVRSPLGRAWRAWRQP